MKSKISGSKKKVVECHAVFPGYTGSVLWEVLHPDFKEPVKVLAPEEAAASKTAAGYWGRRWEDVRFYAYCECHKK